jgi:predicted Zn-dependent protease
MMSASAGAAWERGTRSRLADRDRGWRGRLAACALAVWVAAPAAASEIREHLSRAMEAIHAEDIETAAEILEPLIAQRANDPSVMAVAGVLRLNQQRYDEAVKLLEQADASEDYYLDLARKTRDTVRGYGRVEGEHFIITFPAGKDEILAPYAIEALERQRKALEEDLGYAPPGKVVVEILHHTRALAQVSTLSEEDIKTSGTIAICKFNKLMVVSPKALLKGYDWLDTLAHEYTHYVVTRRTRGNTPIWLHEGIAKYEETRWRGPAGEAISPYAAALLKDAARREKLIPFRDMHPSMALVPEKLGLVVKPGMSQAEAARIREAGQEAAALAFAEVVVAVEYLQKKGGRPLMNQILDRIQRGAKAEAAVAESLGISFDAFIADWRAYLAARPLPKGGDSELARLRFKDDPEEGAHSEWSEIPDAKARAFARLGEILRTRGKWHGARVEYGKAIKRVGARFPVLSDKYALAAMMTGHDAEAERVLADALKEHPRYAALHLHLARLYVKKKMWAQAKEALLLANRTDPFDPEIHAGLATALEHLGDKEGAARETRFTKLLLGKPPGENEGR